MRSCATNSCEPGHPDRRRVLEFASRVADAILRRPPRHFDTRHWALELLLSEIGRRAGEPCGTGEHASLLGAARRRPGEEADPTHFFSLIDLLIHARDANALEMELRPLARQQPFEADTARQLLGYVERIGASQLQPQTAALALLGALQLAMRASPASNPGHADGHLLTRQALVRQLRARFARLSMRGWSAALRATVERALREVEARQAFAPAPGASSAPRGRRALR